MKGVYLGFNDNEIITYDNDAHILTVAQSGAGKNASLIMPNLLMDTFEGTKIILDLKGENAAVCGGWKEENGVGKQFILNPWDIFGMGSIKFNPFCALDAYSDTIYEDCAGFAEAIYNSKENDHTNGEHFDEMARDLITSFLMYLTIKKAVDGENEPPNPVELSDTIDERTLSAKDIAELAEEIYDIAHPDEYIKRALDKSATALKRITIGGENGEYRGIVTTVSKALKSFRGKTLAKSVMATKAESRGLMDVLFQNVLEGNHDLYISFPQKNMKQARVWLRLVLTAFIHELMKEAPARPVLFVLDEFPQLGTFKIIPDNAAFLRGYHVRFWFIAQNIGQLEANYGKSEKQTIMENCTVRQFFNVTDETAKYVSEKMGKEEVIIKNMGTMEYRSTYDKFVMTRTEVEQCKFIINFIGRNNAFFTNKIPYYKWPDVFKNARPNPLISGILDFKRIVALKTVDLEMNKRYGGIEKFQKFNNRRGDIEMNMLKLPEGSEAYMKYQDALDEWKKISVRCEELGNGTPIVTLMDEAIKAVKEYDALVEGETTKKLTG